MTQGMPNHTHPDDELLSALASRDAEAADNVALTDHVTTCDRCATVVDDLRLLRTALTELPDLRPSRPLRLVPAVEADATRDDRLAGWVRRIFGPVLAAGAAIAMVGLVGTTAPILDGMAIGGDQVGDELSGAAASPDTMAEGDRRHRLLVMTTVRRPVRRTTMGSARTVSNPNCRPSAPRGRWCSSPAWH
jgi:hypothetical protein